jgi:hypothetical protein
MGSSVTQRSITTQEYATSRCFATQGANEASYNCEGEASLLTTATYQPQPQDNDHFGAWGHAAPLVAFTANVDCMLFVY